MEGEIKLGKKIGEGDEKVVYEDPNSKEKVIAVFKERIPESPNTVKARFYFTRILHLLFPNNIPDIHWSGSNPHAYSTKRVDEDLARGIKNSFRLYYKTKKQKEGISELTENLHQLGMGLDIGPYNFMEDSSGQMLYVDSFWPWQEIIGKGLLELNFNIEKITAAIDALPSEEKKPALNYLSRILELQKVEQEIISSKNIQRAA